MVHPQIENLTLWNSRIHTHLAFLNNVAKNHSEFFDKQQLPAIVSLYKKMMPLVAKHGSKNIWLPLPVMWIFHVHLLHPLEYMRDCERNFGHLVLYNPKADSLDPKETQQAFLDMYGVPFAQHEQVESTFSSTLDLVFCAANQKTFTKQVSIFDQIDVATSVSNYYKFILCVKKALELNSEEGFTFVPTLEIDLIWHTHMRYPYEYLTFVKEETGFLLNHEDDRSDLDEEFVKTASFWKQEYKEDYVLTKKASDSQVLAPQTQKADCCSTLLSEQHQKADCCNSANTKDTSAVLKPMHQKADCCSTLVQQHQKADCCNSSNQLDKSEVLQPMHQKADCCSTLIQQHQKADCCNSSNQLDASEVLKPMHQKADCCSTVLVPQHQKADCCSTLIQQHQKADCCNSSKQLDKSNVLKPMHQKADCCSIVFPAMTQKADCCNSSKTLDSSVVLLPMHQKADCCSTVLVPQHQKADCCSMLVPQTQKAECCNTASHNAVCTIIPVKENIVIPSQLENVVYA